MNSTALFQTELAIDTNMVVGDTHEVVAETRVVVADTHTAVADTRTMVADIHRSVLTGQNGTTSDKNLSVGVICYPLDTRCLPLSRLKPG